MVQISNARSIKLLNPSSSLISIASRPVYNSKNSSTNGSMYTSKHYDVTDCLPEISRHNIRKNFLVLNQGGKL
jgi:hypothetical protein